MGDSWLDHYFWRDHGPEIRIRTLVQVYEVDTEVKILTLTV